MARAAAAPHPWWESIKGVARIVWRGIQRWQEDNGLMVSASMAYYGALSLFPLTLVLIAGFGVISRWSAALQSEQLEAIDAVGNSVSPWLAEQLRALLSNIESRAGSGGPIGMLLLLGTALGAFQQLDYLIDRLWGKPSDARQSWSQMVLRWFGDRLRAFGMLLVAGLLILLGVAAKATLSAFQAELGSLPEIPGVGLVLGNLTTWLVHALAFTLIYKTLPPRPIAWRQAAMGGIAVTLLWDLGQRILTTWVIGQNYSAYGVVGIFMAVMLWIYYASAIVFLGLEIVWVMVHEPDGPPQSAPQPRVEAEERRSGNDRLSGDQGG